MKENSMEELQERLETLHVTQDARLACNADDLDIREEIAEVEEEIKELQDDTNADRENSIKNERSSIEEDIKIALDKFSNNRDIDSAILIVEKFILGNYILLGGRGNIVKDSLRYILLDYKRVLKENEELKDIDLTTVHIKGVCDEKDRWRNKIRELILNKKQKIQENSKEIEECRKTIMEEQELKKLKLHTLHKNNDLLELEIADLFNLLKEE